MRHWLVKQEPESYSWSDLVKDGQTAWTGVRNYTARNNLRAMTMGDLVLYYHSVSEKRIVGIAKVVRAAYADPTAKEGDWASVDIAPVKALKRPLTLEQIKAEPRLADMQFIRQSRLSVSPVTKEQFEHILKLAS
jgi:predicted RNA-binding protein with PUA-like domain